MGSEILCFFTSVSNQNCENRTQFESTYASPPASVFKSYVISQPISHQSKTIYFFFSTSISRIIPINHCYNLRLLQTILEGQNCQNLDKKNFIERKSIGKKIISWKKSFLLELVFSQILVMVVSCWFLRFLRIKKRSFLMSKIGTYYFQTFYSSEGVTKNIVIQPLAYLKKKIDFHKNRTQNGLTSG